MEDATADVQMFKVMRWVKTKLCQELPLLEVIENRWVSVPPERAESLSDTLTALLNAALDLPT